MNGKKGAHLAELSLFLNISNTLAAFNITKQVDAAGKEIEPKVDFSTGGAITYASPLDAGRCTS